MSGDNSDILTLMKSISDVNAAVATLTGVVTELKNTIDRSYEAQAKDIQNLRTDIDNLFTEKNKLIAMVNDLDKILTGKIAELKLQIAEWKLKTAAIKEDQVELKAEKKDEIKAVVETRRFRLTLGQSVVGLVIAALTALVAYLALK